MAPDMGKDSPGGLFSAFCTHCSEKAGMSELAWQKSTFSEPGSDNRVEDPLRAVVDGAIDPVRR